MSSCYLRLKNYSKAMEYAEICIKLKPKWPKGYYRKGMVFFEQENYVDSATSFYMGCELDPKDKKLSSMVKTNLDDYCIVPGQYREGKETTCRRRSEKERSLIPVSFHV